MKIYSGIKAVDDKYVYDLPTRQIQIQDDLPYLEYFANGGSVKEFMADKTVWGEDLTDYNGFYDKVGGDNFCPNIHAAIKRASNITK